MKINQERLTNLQKKTIEFKLRTELNTDNKLRKFTDELYKQYCSQMPQLKTDAVIFAEKYLNYFLIHSDINLEVSYKQLMKITKTKPSTYYAYRDAVLGSFAWIFEKA